MKPRALLLDVLTRARESMWLLPALLSVLAVPLAFLASWLDHVARASADTAALPFLYHGDREGARSILATIAGSMITVAGVTFSVTMVALSLASQQFGPRLLSNFMRDRGNQVVLGTYIATFLYCLLALGIGPEKPGDDFAPPVTPAVGVVLAALSIGVLIYFIHHASVSIRAERVIQVVAREARHALDRLFGADGETSDPADDGDVSPDPARDAVVEARRDGYIQIIDERGLIELAAGEDIVLRTLRRPGHFVVAGEPLLAVGGGRASAESIGDRARGCIVVGRQRTGENDPEHGIGQLVEVALRALSPGINDPFTAMTCIDWLTAMLSRTADRTARPPRRCGPDGRVRLLVDTIAWEALLDSAFDQIRHHARAHPTVSVRLLEGLLSIARRAGDADRRERVRAQAEMVLHGALEEQPLPGDRQELEQRHAAVLRALRARPAARARSAGA